MSNACGLTHFYQNRSPAACNAFTTICRTLIYNLSDLALQALDGRLGEAKFALGKYVYQISEKRTFLNYFCCVCSMHKFDHCSRIHITEKSLV